MTPERFAKLKAALNRRQPDLTVVSEDVHKLHNISALLRSCDAAGVFEMHAVTQDAELRTHHRMAGGSRRWVKVRRHTSTIDPLVTLKNNNFQIYAAHISDSSLDYRDVDYTRPTAIILGAELLGVSADAARMADTHIRIPMYGLVESLNVSVANALILYEALRQRESAGLYNECRIDTRTRERTLFEWCYPGIASTCRRKKIPYPGLDEEGSLTENPFRESTAHRTSGATS